MELMIRITKADAIAEVSKTSAYIGAKTIAQDGENMHCDISVIKEDAEMLERYWNEACSNVAAVAKEYVTGAVMADTGWTLTLDMPSKYNRAFDGVLKQQVFSYIVRAMLYEWLLMCGYDASALKVYIDECDGMLAGIDGILHARTSARAEDGPAGDNVYGGCMRQNVWAVKVKAVRLRVKN